MPIEVGVALVPPMVSPQGSSVAAVAAVRGGDLSERRQSVGLHCRNICRLLHCLLGQAIETRVSGQVVYEGRRDEGLP